MRRGHGDSVVYPGTVCIIVTYNSERHILACLNAVHAAGIDSIVVVDNSLEVVTSDAIQRWKDGSVELIRHGANVGFGRGVNLGVAAAPQFDYLLLLNPDCRLTPSALNALHLEMQKNPRLGAVAPAMVYPDGSRGIAGGGRPSLWKEVVAATRIDDLLPEPWIVATLHRMRGIPAAHSMLSTLDTKSPSDVSSVYWASGFCMLVRREAWEYSRGFDPRFFLYFEDVALCQTIRTGGWEVAIAGNVEVLHYESESSTSREKSKHYYRGLATYLRHYGTRWQRIAARILSWYLQ